MCICICMYVDMCRCACVLRVRRTCNSTIRFLKYVVMFDNAWMISGLKLSSTLPKVATKS